MKTTKIQLGEFKNVNSINQDLRLRLPLEYDNKLFVEYDINNVLNVTELYEQERQDSETYRIYGEIEYLSPLNGMMLNYSELSDFFTIFPSSASTKSILTDFNFYMLAPTTAYTGLITGSTGGTFIKNYEVISKLENFEIYNAGFSKNIFNEQQYTWDFNIDFNLKNKLDGLNFPLTEVYLYAQYQPKLNGDSELESISGKTYDSSGGTIITPISITPLNVGDIIIGDIIEWNKIQFLQETLNRQEYYLKTPYITTGGSFALIWKYNPIIPVTIDVFEDEVQQVNISGTSYQDIVEVPAYATKIDNNGNYVWRNLQDKGFVDPLTLQGVNFPFVNQRHYVFNNIVLTVKPDFDDTNTLEVFTEIQFPADTFISNEPNSNLDNIGKPCA